MTKEWIRTNWEMDWDNENMFFTVTEEGKIIKYDIITDELFEYEMERVEH